MVVGVSSLRHAGVSPGVVEAVDVSLPRPLHSAVMSGSLRSFLDDLPLEEDARGGGRGGGAGGDAGGGDGGGTGVAAAPETASQTAIMAVSASLPIASSPEGEVL